MDKLKIVARREYMKMIKSKAIIKIARKILNRIKRCNQFK